MPPIRCTLFSESSTEHLTQLYAGFALLARAGEVKVRVRRAARYHPGVAAKWPVAEVHLEESGRRLVYDLSDGGAIRADRLAACDLYFKRSYDADRISLLPGGEKVRPYGLNYSVYAPGDWWVRRLLWSAQASRGPGGAARVLAQAVRSSGLLSRLRGSRVGRASASVHALHAPPTSNVPPRILFLARLWEPKGKDDPRHEINHQRAAVIRRLRSRFGERFRGGLQDTPYARQHHPDLIVGPQWTDKRAYLRRVAESDICIATRGLKGSNGWKLGEYVAFSRAIVSEPLVYRVPGGFAAGRHYLPFTTAEACVEAVEALMEDDARRRAMQVANERYYHQHLRPDALIRNTLIQALEPVRASPSREPLPSGHPAILAAPGTR